MIFNTPKYPCKIKYTNGNAKNDDEKNHGDIEFTGPENKNEKTIKRFIGCQLYEA